MPLHFLHIQDFSAKRQNGLEVAVAPLLGRATGGVTLDEEYLAVLGILVRAVGQLAGQPATAHGVLALHTLARLAGGDTCRGGQHHLVAYQLGFLGVFLQIERERLAHSLLHGSCHLRVAQFGLGLALKLRLGHLYGDDGCQSFAEVLAGNFYLRLFYLLGDGGVLVGIVLQRSGERHSETGEVGAAFYGVDVVHIGMDVL